MSFIFWGFVVGFLKGLSTELAREPVPAAAPVFIPPRQTKESLRNGMLKMR